VKGDAGVVRGLQLDLVADGRGECRGPVEDEGQDGQLDDQSQRANHGGRLIHGCLLRLITYSRCSTTYPFSTR
jgi:hypothetical protein